MLANLDMIDGALIYQQEGVKDLEVQQEDVKDPETQQNDVKVPKINEEGSLSKSKRSRGVKTAVGICGMRLRLLGSQRP